MTLYSKKPTIVTLEVAVHPDIKHAFVDWQAKFNARIVSQPGFISLELLATSEKDGQWIITQRFTTAETASSWRTSKQYEGLLTDLKGLALNGQIKENLADPGHAGGGVTEVILAEIKPDQESSFKAWSAKIHQAEAKFPGFRGVYVQSPEDTRGNHWITLLQFDSNENLDHWLDSAERRELLKESTSMVTSFESHRVFSPYAGWFASIARISQIPPAWKQAMIVLLMLFPIVMLEIKYLSPLLLGFNISSATFIGNAISVSLLTFPVMPLAILGLGWWLSPDERHAKSWTIWGTCLVCLLYALEIFLFWN